jgi:hypothetical protein
MGYRQDGDDCRAIFVPLNTQDDHAWAIFEPFVLTGLVFAAPKIGVGDDKARLRGRDRRHAPKLFLIEQSVQVIVSRIHTRLGDRLDLFVRKFLGCEAVALVLEALESLVVIWPDKIAGDLAMARNGHGFSLSLHPITAKISSKLGRRYGRCHVNGSFFKLINTQHAQVTQVEQVAYLGAEGDESSGQ